MLGVYRSVRRPSLKGRERAIFNQTNIRNCLKGDVGETSERRGGAHMGFSELIGAILNLTELTGFGSDSGQIRLQREVCQTYWIITLVA